MELYLGRKPLFFYIFFIRDKTVFSGGIKQFYFFICLTPAKPMPAKKEYKKILTNHFFYNSDFVHYHFFANKK